VLGGGGGGGGELFDDLSKRHVSQKQFAYCVGILLTAKLIFVSF
jgi:hypothetical protein